MKNYLERNAKHRQQLSIPEAARRLLLEFGTCRRAGDWAENYAFDKKSLREDQGRLEPGS